MDADFWLERWRLNEIGFHQANYNARLTTHWPALDVPKGATVFVPLCGKSKDMIWLAQAGHKVLGVELSPVAIEAFFQEAAAPYSYRQMSPLSSYEGNGIRILCGDFFDIDADDLVGTGGAFDRGALVALPPAMRRRYVDHLLTVLPVRAEILLLTLEYDQARVGGPPFSVQRAEVESLYGDRCSIVQLESVTTDQVPPRFSAQGVVETADCTYRIVKER